MFLNTAGRSSVKFLFITNLVQLNLANEKSTELRGIQIFKNVLPKVGLFREFNYTNLHNIIWSRMKSKLLLK